MSKMLNTRYTDSAGNIFKMDSQGNRFLNGRLWNPKSWESVDVIKDFEELVDSGIGKGILVPTTIGREIVKTGHKDKFEYYDHDKKCVVFVDTTIGQ